ncbi:hypothetical protein GCM10010470_18840 [Saccharopolyspora taberi]|uniref:Uncharacterized protein n=1 Tax=Saccharopolyspora taberi TaxID=60895 RepID=A0ABN3V9F9_9PSEU
MLTANRPSLQGRTVSGLGPMAPAATRAAWVLDASHLVEHAGSLLARQAARVGEHGQPVRALLVRRWGGSVAHRLSCSGVMCQAA